MNNDDSMILIMMVMMMLVMVMVIVILMLLILIPIKNSSMVSGTLILQLFDMTCNLLIHLVVEVLVL